MHPSCSSKIPAGIEEEKYSRGRWWQWRALLPGEIDHEMLWSTVSVTISAIAIFWLRTGLPTPVCTFHQWTGFPCPSCGATRAVQRLYQGNLLAALHFNPLAVIGIGAMFVFDLYAVLVLAFRLPRLRLHGVPRSISRPARFVAGAVILLNWLWLIYARV